MTERRPRLHVWEIDGEDLIVAASEREMRAMFWDYHGESIRGRHTRRVPAGEKLALCGDDDLVVHKTARRFTSIGKGYYPARR